MIELTNNSKILLNFLFMNSLTNIKLSNISKELFMYIFKIFLEYSKVNSIDKIKSEREIENKKINSILKTEYLPNQISNYINKTSSRCVKYIFFILSKKVIISYYIFTDNIDINKLDLYTYYVKMILYLLSKKLLHKCNKELNIKIYLTPFKRSLPENSDKIIGVNNINGGFSNYCATYGEIVVYRQEEWLKVLIHECFHSYGLEFSNLDLKDFNKEIKKLFPINSKFNIFESYAETWAEIINVALVSFIYSRGNSNFYINYVEKFLKYEREYSVFQLNKILCYNNLQYVDLFKENNNYNEGTNMFAYYLIKTLFIYYINKYIEWCYKNNYNYFNFNREKLHLFYNFIKKIYNDKSFIQKLDNNRLYLHSLEKKTNYPFIIMNLRMTSIEI